MYIIDNEIYMRIYHDQWPTMCPVQTFYILLRGSWEQKGFLKVPQPSKLSPREKGAGTQVEKRKLKEEGKRTGQGSRAGGLQELGT